jgi:hypothetical protein
MRGDEVLTVGADITQYQTEYRPLLWTEYPNCKTGKYEIPVFIEEGISKSQLTFYIKLNRCHLIILFIIKK